jgi:hypothetical protein
MRLRPAVLLAIGAAAGPAWSQEHPQVTLLVREIAPTDTLKLVGARGAPFLVPAAGARMLTFGALEGEEHEILGGVTAVAVIPDGRLAVLDEANSVIRILDPQGRYVGSIGRAGRGPGDFFHARSMAVDAEGNLYVGDLLRRVQRFRSKGNSFELDTVLATRVSPDALCIMDSTIVVHAVNPEVRGLVHLSDLRGRYLRSFGEAYRSNSEIINIQVTMGRIACLPKAGLIAFIPDGGAVRELRLYDLRGRTRRLSIVAGMRSNRLIETPNGSSVRFSPGGNHYVATLLPTPDERLLLQIGLKDQRSRSEGLSHSEMYTAIFGLSPSAPVDYSRGDLQVAAFTDGRPVFVVEDPAPGITWERKR